MFERIKKVLTRVKRLREIGRSPAEKYFKAYSKDLKVLIDIKKYGENTLPNGFSVRILRPKAFESANLNVIPAPCPFAKIDLLMKGLKYKGLYEKTYYFTSANPLRSL